MITILLNLVLAILTTVLLTVTDAMHWGWALILGIVVLIGGQITVGRIFRKKMTAMTDQMQAVMQQAQARMQAKVQRWRTKQMTNQKAAEMELAKDRDAMISEIQALIKPLERYRLWIPLLGRQLATMELQFAWQKKDWKRVDELLERALLTEPLLVCMKLVRMWKKNIATEEMMKFFTKATKRARYGTTALVYCTMAWMLVKRERVDEAFKLLNEADTKNEHPVIKSNRDCLANNRINHFSNTGFGEEWYALFLEEPKMRTQRQRNPGRYFA